MRQPDLQEYWADGLEAAAGRLQADGKRPIAAQIGLQPGSAPIARQRQQACVVRLSITDEPDLICLIGRQDP